MTTTLNPRTPDLAAANERRRQARTSGDLAVVAATVVVVAEQLCDSAELRAGWRVLDVATGSGNGALAAARRGCATVGIDGDPALLERGARRADAEGLHVQLVEGAAEALPFPDACFEAVISVFGCMFAAGHVRVAAELLRVCKPGGTIALASWTPDGFVGELTRTLDAYAPPPAGAPSPVLWGTQEYLRHLWDDDVASLEVAERTWTFAFLSAEHVVTFLRLWYEPVAAAFAALEGPACDALEADLVALARRFDAVRAPEPVVIPATYLEAVAFAR